MAMVSPYTHSQQAAFAIIPHFSSMLSIFGIVFIIQDVLRDPKKRSRIYCRLMVGASVYQLVGAVATFFSTWAIPANEPILYASGTTATCTAQGFAIQISGGMTVYSLGITGYYFLILVHHWPDWKLQRLEKYVHGLALVFSLGTASLGLALKLYNNANLWCWISSLPQTCEGGNMAEDGAGECERGQNAWLYRLLLFYLYVFLAIVVHVVVMARVTWYVYSTERKSRKYRFSDSRQSKCATRSRNSVSKQVFWQSVHYVGAYCITWVFPIVTRVLEGLKGQAPPAAIICMCLFGPLSGFWCFTIYMRPRFLQRRPSTPRAWIRTQADKLSIMGTSMLTHTAVRLSRMGASGNSTEPSSGSSKPSNHLEEAINEKKPPVQPSLDFTDMEVSSAWSIKADEVDDDLEDEILTEEMMDISAYDPSFVLMMSNSQNIDQRLSNPSHNPHMRCMSLSNPSHNPHLRCMSSTDQRISQSTQGSGQRFSLSSWMRRSSQSTRASDLSQRPSHSSWKQHLPFVSSHHCAQTTVPLEAPVEVSEEEEGVNGVQQGSGES